MFSALQDWLDESGLSDERRRSLMVVLGELMRSAVARLMGQTASGGFAPAVLDLVEEAGGARAIAPPALPDGPGRFEWTCRIGEGGTSEVWRVHDPILGRKLALKVLRAELLGSAEARERFAAEVRATAALAHPGVVPVYEAGILPDGRPYFLMREIEGRTLSEVLEVGALDRAGTIDVVRRVAQTVAHAHARGATHRDLKPDNVMIGPFGEVLVLDWGLVRDTSGGPSPEDARHTRAGDILGTPAFMAPEQARGEATGPWTDIWALGALLYTALSGRAPYGDAPAAELLEAAREGRVARPEFGSEPRLRPLAAITARAMAASPADRYPSASSLVSDLDAWLAGTPVSAYRYGRWERVGLWFGRHRAAGITGAVAVALLSLLSLVALLGIRSERDEALSHLAESRVLATLHADGEDNYGEAGNLTEAASLAKEALRALEEAGVPEGGPEDPRPDLRGILARASSARLPTPVARMPEPRCLRLAWSPDGLHLACAAAGEGLILWEADGGGERRLASGLDVRSLSWADADTVWLGAADAVVYRWETGPDQESSRFPLTGGIATEVAALPVGGVVLGGEVPQLWMHHPPASSVSSEAYLAIAFALSPDGRWLATGTEHLSSLWDLDTPFQIRREVSLPQGSGVQVSAQWSPDGSRLAWVGTDGQIQLTDREGRWMRSFGQCPGTLYGLGWQDDTTLYTGGGDGTVRSWDVATGRENLRVPSGGGAVESMAVRADRLAVGRVDGVEIWSLPSPRPQLPSRTVSSFLHVDADRGLAWVTRYTSARRWAGDELELVAMPMSSAPAPSPRDPERPLWPLTGAGRWILGQIASAAEPGENVPVVFDPSSGRMSALPPNAGWHFRAAALARDASRVALVDPGGTLHLYDVGSSREIGAWALPSEPMLAEWLPGSYPIHLLDDGAVVAECWPAGQVRFREAVSGTVLGTLAGPDGAALEQWAFSPDEQTIAWAMVDGRVYLQDRSSGRLRPLRAEGTNFAPFAFFDEGRKLASGGTDGRTYVWNVESAELIARFRAHDTRTWRLASYIGSDLVTMGFGRGPRRWDLSAGSLQP